MRVCHGDWIERPSLESEPLGDKKNVNLAGVTVVGVGVAVGVAVGGVVGAAVGAGVSVTPATWYRFNEMDITSTSDTEKNKSNRKIVQKGKGKLGCVGQEALTATTTSSEGFTLSRTGVE